MTEPSARFYGFAYDYRRHVVSIREGGVVERTSKSIAEELEIQHQEKRKARRAKSDAQQLFPADKPRESQAPSEAAKVPDAVIECKA